MKKRILALVTVLLFAVLMIAAVSAAPAIEIATPAAGTDLSALTGKVVSDPTREQIDVNVQEHMIVELYSR